MSLSISAYAKINLTLDITGRRNDGYHILDSVMQSISLHDDITVKSTCNNTIDVFCDSKNVPGGEKNIVYRASKIFFLYAGIKSKGVSFYIKKHIPIQAGLGGGSADAAAAIKLLNCFYCTGFSTEQLCSIGIKAGADVPFCIRGGTALAQGIGEELTVIPPLPNCIILVCKPAVTVSTKNAYAIADKIGFAGIRYTHNFLCELKNGNLSKIASCLGNCFENLLQIDEITKIKSVMLSAGALGACMTGSGSAVFGLFDSHSKADQCKNLLLSKYKNIYLCNPVR